MNLWAPITVIGGGGGGYFEDFGADGKVLERLGVWAGGWQIKAIQVTRTGGEVRTFGVPSGPYKEFTFQPGERITRMSLWGNGAGTRLGWIFFETNRSRSFDFGMTEWGKKQEYPVNVGSGICVGMLGRAGSDVDAGGFVFLNPIRSSVLKDVAYPTLTFDSLGITPRTLDSFSDRNTGSQPRQWHFDGRHETSTSETWSMTAGLEVYSETTVEASIPEIVTVGEKFGWKLSASSTYSRTTTETHEVSWGESGTLEPNQSISLRAVMRVGNLSIPYKGTMVIHLQDGEFSYPVEGIYGGVTHTAVEIVDAPTE